MKHIILLGFLLPICAQSQVMHITPSKPSYKDTINVDYQDTLNAYKDNAVLYARVNIALEDGEFRKKTVALDRHSKNRFHGWLTVRENTIAIQLELYSLNKEAGNGTATVVLHDPVKKLPMPGGLMAFQYFGDLLPVLKQEISMHPDKYLVYGQYFNVQSFNQNEASRSLIKKYMIPLEQKVLTGASPAPDLLAALCIGYAKTSRLDSARIYMLELLRKFPRSGTTRLAFNFYDYEWYKAGNQGCDPKILSSCKDIFLRYPHAALSRDYNLNYYLRADTSISFENFKSALLFSLKEDSLDYLAQITLVNTYIDRNEKLEEAENILLRSLNNLQFAEVNHQYRYSAVRFKSAVANAYRQLALIAYRRKDLVKTALYCTAALHSFEDTNEYDNYADTLLKLRANAYVASNNITMAMDDYKKLYQNGDKEAAGRMQSLFPQYQSEAKNFQDLLAGLNGKTGERKGHKTTAPNFSATNLNGDTIKLENLKGKVVVLNFWGTGCGPCVREMPELNKLVQQNAANPDVVFLALALDDTKALKQFFQKRSFTYNVLNNCSDAWKNYQISGLPIHIVIDKEGIITTRLIGAQTNIASVLQKAIDRNL